MNFFPPTDGATYFSLENLLHEANQHACSQGYAVTIKKSKKDKKGFVRKAWLRCDRGFRYKPANYDKRQSSIRQTKCQFFLIAVRDAETEVWILNVIDSTHNHQSILGKSHFIHKQNVMIEDVKQIVVFQTRINASTKQIVSVLRLDENEENSFIKIQDIYNIRATHRRKKLSSYSSVQALMRELRKRENGFMKHTVNGHERIIKLFFAKTSAQKILKLNYEVLLMDCTYKTNTYRMPLCVINGVTAMNIIFYIGFCFMSKEKTENYTGVLESYKDLLKSLNISDLIVFVFDSEPDLIAAIPKIYSEADHLLCLWHINKNVLTNCRPWFDTDEAGKEFYVTGNTMLYVKIEQDFENAGNALRLKYQNNFVLVDYLKNLIQIHKTKIIKCFTDQISHFGNISTSRIESAHAKLKSELKIFIGKKYFQFYEHY